MRKISFVVILKISLLILLPILLFSPTFSTYFSQDDFFHLRVVMDKKLTDIPSFFLSKQQEYAFYRPLSRETFNLLMYQLFNLNPVPFHLFNLLLILINTILLLLVVKKVSTNNIISYLAALFYAVSAVHSVELYYLASVQTLLATVFLQLSLLAFLLFLDKPRLKIYVLSIIFFVGALLSHEISIVFPGILVSLGLLKGFRIKQLAYYLSIFVIITLVYLLRTSLLNSLPGEQVYQPVISIKSFFNTLMWYILWSFGLAEMLVDFIGPGFRINPNLIKWYSSYLTVVIPLLSGIFITLLPLYLIQSRLKDVKLLLFYFSSFIISLSPFLFFPQHKSIYYLGFAIIWFSSLLATLSYGLWVNGILKKIWLVTLILSFIYISYNTTNLNKITYWAAKRGAAAEFILSDIKKSYPTLPKGSIIYVKKDPSYPVISKEWGSSSKQVFYILSGSDAFKLNYHDTTLQVYFEDVDQLSQGKLLKAVIYQAKFPF